MFEAREIRVRGTVQGVGFRPAVWRLARAHRLAGEVLNDAEGVLIRISGEACDIAAFLQCLPREAPPLARIEAIEVRVCEPLPGCQDFIISISASGGSHTGVSPDAAICLRCAGEIRDPGDRRHLYPFGNCTHCGPRLSIIRSIPYDRERTTLRDFVMCAECRAEYDDPADRRFHAQPIACHRCGPSIVLESNAPCGADTAALPSRYLSAPKLEDAIETTRECLDRVVAALRDGQIVALKGLGGFHLCCDACNDPAVGRLRERKRRDAKPFALMAPDIPCIEGYGILGSLERELLQSAQAPIVLLDKKPDSGNEPLELARPLSDRVAPGTGLLGFMLPYTPLHRLILERFAGPLVMTSGNLADEPQVIDNLEAKLKLGSIADWILYHNRDIANRIDDSVVRVMDGRARLIRRARGYAPRALPMPRGFENCPDLLAFGGELKATFSLLKDGSAILSQHQGDLEEAATFEDYEKNLELYRELFEHRPAILVADMHPEYLSGKLAYKTAASRFQADREERENSSWPLIEVQHHHAHIASCLAENGVAIDAPEVLGIALDGLGFGDCGELWGGEFLLCDYRDYRRVAAFKPVAMPGGLKAIREPWRNTYAHIVAAMGWATFKQRYGPSELCADLESRPLALLDRMLAGNVNAPLASSCGRLFDAVAAALGICRDRAGFEGQAAIELEMGVDPVLYKKGRADSAYAFGILPGRSDEGSGRNSATPEFFTLDPSRLWMALLDDLARGTSRTVIATRFHAGLVQAVLNMVEILRTVHRFAEVALSGGCFQNKYLLEGLSFGLEAKGFRCLTQSLVPANDGGLSLGQAAIGAARILAGSAPSA